MAEKKITKAERFAEIKAILVEQDADANAELIEFVDSQVEALAKKAEKAKERAAEKAAKGDELRAQIEALITEDWQSVDAIVAQVEGEDITKGKVVARLTQLFKAQIVEKDEQKVGDKRCMCYRLKVAGATEVAEDAE